MSVPPNLVVDDDLQALEHLLRENQKEQTWLERELQQIEFLLKKFEADAAKLKPELHKQKSYAAVLRLAKQIDHAKGRVEEIERHLKNAHFSELILRKKISKMPKSP